MQKNDLIVITLLPIAALALAFVFGWMLPRIRRHRQLRGPITLAWLADATDTDVPPRPSRPAAAPTPAWAPVPSTEPPLTAASAVAAPAQREATGTDGIARPDARSPTDQPHLRLEPAFESTVGPPPPHSRADARSAGLKVHRPMDGTLQFLPGRLEVVEGRDVGQEIRFVRLPGTQETEVTLGRADGPAYRHVQLHEPTVSRMHAKMTLEGKRWRLTNLSRTNPVVVNGAPLEPDGASVVLSDGDRVEMGEVACRFRAK